MKIKFIKVIFIIFGGVLALYCFLYLIAIFLIAIPDAKDNRIKAELHYQELSRKYEKSGGYAYETDYTYSSSKNTGYIAGGGYIGTACQERYIRDAWLDKEIMSVSLCVDEKITKEKLKKLEEFHKKYNELFWAEVKITNPFDIVDVLNQNRWNKDKGFLK